MTANGACEVGHQGPERAVKPNVGGAIASGEPIHAGNGRVANCGTDALRPHARHKIARSGYFGNASGRRPWKGQRPRVILLPFDGS